MTDPKPKPNTVLKPERGAMNTMASTAYKLGCGRELTLRELRLIPFIVYVVTNEGIFHDQKVSALEMGILRDLKEEGLVLLERAEGKVGFYQLAVTPNFWAACNAVLLHTYVIKAVRRD